MSEGMNPCEFDVLCGKGNAVASHKGNELFRCLIAKYVKEYETTPNNGVKRNLVEKVRQGVKDSNGRFLVEAPGSPLYYEQTEDKVTKKIQQAFRDKIKSMNKSSLNSVQGLRSSLGSTTSTTSSLKTRPASNLSQGQPMESNPIPLELDISLMNQEYHDIKQDMTNDFSMIELQHSGRSEMLRMGGSRNLTVQQIDPMNVSSMYLNALGEDRVQDNRSQMLWHNRFSTLPNEGDPMNVYCMDRKTRDDVNNHPMEDGLSYNDSRNDKTKKLEPEGLIDVAARERDSSLLFSTGLSQEMITKDSRNLLPNDERKLEPEGSDWTQLQGQRQAWLRMAKILSSSRSNCVTTSMSVISNANSLRGVADGMRDSSDGGDKTFDPSIFDDTEMGESFRRLLIGCDVSMSSLSSQGESTQRAEV